MNKEIIENIVNWAEEKGIFESSSPRHQIKKTIEEVYELEEAIELVDYEQIQLELGDVLITLVILSALLGFELDDAANAAYAKISKRKGKMVNGLFVKDGDKND